MSQTQMVKGSLTGKARQVYLHSTIPKRKATQSAQTLHQKTLKIASKMSKMH